MILWGVHCCGVGTGVAKLRSMAPPSIEYADVMAQLDVRRVEPLGWATYQSPAGDLLYMSLVMSGKDGFTRAMVQGISVDDIRSLLAQVHSSPIPFPDYQLSVSINHGSLKETTGRPVLATDLR